MKRWEKNRSEKKRSYSNSQSGTVRFRLGNEIVDCKHCGKWLSWREIRKWKDYCDKCSAESETGIEHSNLSDLKEELDRLKEEAAVRRYGVLPGGAKDRNVNKEEKAL